MVARVISLTCQNIYDDLAGVRRAQTQFECPVQGSTMKNENVGGGGKGAPALLSSLEEWCTGQENMKELGNLKTS